MKFNIWDHGGLLSWRIIYCFKRFFLWHQTSKTIEISPWKWLLSLSKRSVYYVVVQWSQLTDHIVSLLLMTTNPRCEKRSVSKEFKILRAFFNEFIKIFSPSLSNKFPWAFCKTFNILVSSRNCFSGELSCTSSKLGKIQAFCWDSNLRYVLNVRQMPYCHVNFFQGLHISFLLQWLWRQYFLILFS